MYSTAIAYLLFFVGGFGTLGFHRFYLNKIGTGVLYLLTGGLGLVGSVYDFFTLPMQVREANLQERYRRALEYESDLNMEYAKGARRQIKKDSRPDSIEKVILRTAKNNRGIATPSEVALEADINLDEAKKNLELLVSRGFADVRVTKSGSIVYVFPDFSTGATEDNLEDF